MNLGGKVTVSLRSTEIQSHLKFEIIQSISVQIGTFGLRLKNYGAPTTIVLVSRDARDELPAQTSSIFRPELEWGSFEKGGVL